MSQVDRIFCLVRRGWVKATPEERVRQQLLSYMIHQQAYPFSSLAVEKTLSHLPHLSRAQPIPNRRADIICFADCVNSLTSTLYPLLLIECKAIKLSNKVLNQVISYNYFVQAHFVMVVNETEIKMGWYDKTSQVYKFVNYLPSFAVLRHSLTIPLV